MTLIVPIIAAVVTIFFFLWAQSASRRRRMFIDNLNASVARLQYQREYKKWEAEQAKKADEQTKRAAVRVHAHNQLLRLLILRPKPADGKLLSLHDALELIAGCSGDPKKLGLYCILWFESYKTGHNEYSTSDIWNGTDFGEDLYRTHYHAIFRVSDATFVQFTQTIEDETNRHGESRPWGKFCSERGFLLNGESEVNLLPNGWRRAIPRQ